MTFPPRKSTERGSPNETTHVQQSCMGNYRGHTDMGLLGLTNLNKSVEVHYYEPEIR